MKLIMQSLPAVLLTSDAAAYMLSVLLVVSYGNVAVALTVNPTSIELIYVEVLQSAMAASIQVVIHLIPFPLRP